VEAAVGEVSGLSGVRRVMADGTNEDGAHTLRMDELVAWKTVEGAVPRSEGYLMSFLLFNFPFQHSFVRGGRTPRLVHSALPRVVDFFTVVAS
jgi:hypothetical protein